jgi:hypothetical protein
MGRKSISHIRKPEILHHTYKVVEDEGFMGMTIGKVATRTVDPLFQKQRRPDHGNGGLSV